MQKGDIKAEQDIAERKYGEVPENATTEALWKQNLLLAELALQLVTMNETLTRIAMAVEQMESR